MKYIKNIYYFEYYYEYSHGGLKLAAMTACGFAQRFSVEESAAKAL